MAIGDPGFHGLPAAENVVGEFRRGTIGVTTQRPSMEEMPALEKQGNNEPATALYAPKVKMKIRETCVYYVVMLKDIATGQRGLLWVPVLAPVLGAAKAGPGSAHQLSLALRRPSVKATPRMMPHAIWMYLVEVNVLRMFNLGGVKLFFFQRPPISTLRLRMILEPPGPQPIS